MVTSIMPPASPAIRASNSEQADDYRGVVVRLNDDWRVIRCSSGIQWVTQRRLPTSARAVARWQAKSHCRSRADLIGLVARHCGLIEPEAALVLASLPAWIDPSTTAAIDNLNAAVATLDHLTDAERALLDGVAA